VHNGNDLHLPTSLLWLSDVEDGRAWLRSLPHLVTQAVSRWSLALGETYDGSDVRS